MKIVVVDTNLMCRNPDLSGANWDAIINYVAQHEIRVVVPEVVIHEVAAKIRAATDASHVQTARNPFVQAGLTDLAQNVRRDLEERHNNAESWFRSRVEQAGFAIADWPEVTHAEVTRRAADRIAPYYRAPEGGTESAGGRRARNQGEEVREVKDGYRDTLIWFTLLEIAQQHPTDEVWFVSQNYKDFGESSSTELCPAVWHEDLGAELAALRLGEQVHYARDLAAFQSHFTAQMRPMTDAQLDVARIGLCRPELGQLLDHLIYGFSIDAWQAGFPDGAIAYAVGSKVDSESWNFTEAATRFGGGWTARFTVSAELDVVVPDDVEKGVEISRQISGTVWVNHDGLPDELEVSEIGLLPGQLMPEGQAGNRGEASPAEQVMREILKEYWSSGAGKAALSDVVSQVSGDPAVRKAVERALHDLHSPPPPGES